MHVYQKYNLGQTACILPVLFFTLEPQIRETTYEERQHRAETH